MNKSTTALPMNLQLFSNSAPTEGGNPAPSAPNMNDKSFIDSVVAMLSGKGGQAPQTEQPAPAQGEPAPGEGAPVPTDNAPQGQPDQQGNQAPSDGVQTGQQPPIMTDANGLILGKFKSPEEVVNAYANLERFNTQTRQELAAEKQAKAQLESMLQQQAQTQPQDVTAEEGAEGGQMDADTFMNMFYENPAAAIQEIIKQTVSPQLEPIIQKEQKAQRQNDWDSAVNNFASAHDDFGNFQEEMQNILNSRPELGEHPNGIEMIYHMARGKNYQNPDNLVSDENFMNKMVNNPDVRNKVISEYLQTVNKGQQAPVVIAGQPGGTMQITPENRPKTLAEATAMAEKMFGAN